MILMDPLMEMITQLGFQLLSDGQEKLEPTFWIALLEFILDNF